MRTLVVGGTGPTGPHIVEGLLQRGHEVTVLHTGLHEIDLGPEVRHIHADPHFRESLADAVAGQQYDLVLGMYGRLSVVAEVMAGRTEYFFGIGALFYEDWVDNVVHRDAPAAASHLRDYVHLHVPTDETMALGAADGDRFSQKAIEAERTVFAHHTAGRWKAAMFRLPNVYGPRQPAPIEWCIIRRVLDGRRKILVPDAGLLLRARAYAANVAAYVLGAVDRLEQAVGQAFNVGDNDHLTLREWILAITNHMGAGVELASVPLNAATVTFPYSKGPFTMGHRVISLERAHQILGPLRLTPPRLALAQTVEWYLKHPVDDAAQAALRDRFDYELEDRLIETIDRFHEQLQSNDTSVYNYNHAYPHPRTPGET